MHPSLTEAFARLDRSRAALRAAIDAVPDRLRDRRPGSDRWSVAGIVEHVALVDERFITNIAGRIAEARAAGLRQEPGTPAPLPSEVEGILANRADRRQAPEPLHPTGMSWGAAWERAEASRTSVRALLDGAGVALSLVLLEHPRYGALSAYQWAGFLAAHETRHAAQILETATELEAGEP